MTDQKEPAQARNSHALRGAQKLGVGRVRKLSLQAEGFLAGREDGRASLANYRPDSENATFPLTFRIRVSTYHEQSIEELVQRNSKAAAIPTPVGPLRKGAVRGGGSARTRTKEGDEKTLGFGASAP